MHDPKRRAASHPRMSRARRAKIFMPFNPLKGFQEALREKEREAEAAYRKAESGTPWDDA